MLATNVLVARLAADWLPPMTLTFWRWAATGALAVALSAPKRLRDAVRREWLSLAILGSTGMTLCGGAAYLAGEHTSAANIGLIYAASPVLMTILATTFLHEPLGTTRLVGVAACLAGVAAIIAKGDVHTFMELRFNRGDLWALGGSVGWGVYSFLLKRMPTRLDASERFACLCLVGAIASVPFAVAESVNGRTFTLSASSLGLLALTVLVASYGGYLSYARLQQLVGVSVAGLTVYIMPVFAALYGAVFMGEAIQSYHLAGMLLVLAGIWLAGRPV